jgi:hypothetical protein
MLPDNLTANQVKNRAGVAIPFAYVDGPGGRSRTYKSTSAAPYLPHTIVVQHREVGKGVDMIRQSNVTIVKKVVSAVDPTKTTLIRESRTLYVQEGHLADMNDVKDVAANMNSFCSTTGAATVVLFDGTGLGTDALVNGTL